MGIRALITIVVVTVALLVEYAFSDGGVLRWLASAGSTLESLGENLQQARDDAAQDSTPEAPAEPEPIPAPPSAPEAPPPDAAPAPAPPANFGLRTVTGPLTPELTAWLNWLRPGMNRSVAVTSGTAIVASQDIHRPSYSNGSDVRALEGRGFDGYQIIPVVKDPPLAVALVFTRDRLHNWMLYEQNTRGLAEDQAHMLALYEKAGGPSKSPAPAATAPVAPDALNDDSRLADPSFETDPAADDAEWVFDAAGGDAVGGRTRDAFRTGRWSLRMQASQPANRGWPGWKSADRFPLEPGRTYVFRAAARSPDGANAWLDVQLYDKAGTWLGGRSTGCTPHKPKPETWEVFELRLQGDDGSRAASARLGLLQCLNYSRGRTTTLYFDDVYFGP